MREITLAAATEEEKKAEEGRTAVASEAAQTPKAPLVIVKADAKNIKLKAIPKAAEPISNVKKPSKK